MTALIEQFRLSLRLYFRNTMALLYGYLFPTVFLIAFWTLYRYDQVPLVRHVGELLTITVLGGACFGLPTTLVGERERGIWRRYRLTPVPAATVVLSTMLARYAVLLTAALLQLLLAMMLGMPAPRHPLDLWVAFTFVSFAFLGLGLVIATMADTVPAVQALGQSLFLPMLIIGGVAVPLTALPPWATSISAFLPGRYAVDAIQASASGVGLSSNGFNLVALLAIGLAGCVAGGKLFRWDRDQQFLALRGKGWLAVAVAAWIAVGSAASWRETSRSAEPRPSLSIALQPAQRRQSEPSEPAPPSPASAPTPAAGAAIQTPSAHADERPRADGRGASPPASSPTPAPVEPADSGGAAAPSPAEAPAASTAQPSSPPVADAAPFPTSWQAVTAEDIDRDLTFDRLPSDRSVVTPIATGDTPVEPDVLDQVAAVEDELLAWGPGVVVDPVQRVRNFLGVLGAHDVAQTPLEAYLPRVVFRRLLDVMPREDLLKVLYWIAIHPEGGDVLGEADVKPLQLRAMPEDEQEVRSRTAIYAVKLLGRLTGHIK